MTRPRYIIVTPAEGAVITMAVPWDQIEQALKASGFQVIRQGGKRAAAPDLVASPPEPQGEPMYDVPHITEGGVACSCNPLVLTIAPDGSISRIAGGPLEEPISTAAPDPVASPPEKVIR